MEDKETTPKPNWSFMIKVDNRNNNFLKRIWIILTNPFYYIFTGKIRY